MAEAVIARARLRPFLAGNPFPHGWTEGLFYREKMRAIHRIAPPSLGPDDRVLEIGGGRSGLAAMLYPGADVTTLDLDPQYAANQPAGARNRFVCGDARALPFADEHFTVVTLFDVLEHILEHEQAAAEALRVTRPGGFVLVSTPAADWHYPMYGWLRRHAPHERELMDEWGHVRRGYTVEELTKLFGAAPVASASFINAATAFYHDVAFSRLGRRSRTLLYAAAAPLVLGAYALHGNRTKGTEIALAWRK
ncbi:class I SAM-dependent methyltransferase [Sphingomonas sp. BN140010]|uniref:Class I SAM-dependent methyltransferase n=1 Tax=Sphingomonas arvum TaxID=2992113 RepID=A0ABT3JE79_9SPHN|nr:class I SAM-dependent methyltransferase [Sphingomonas sp. BN140010]MCW3797363.1 class I SAM-dependent methyltransferase [Sphingomonas sp. BN140010]